MEYFISIGIIQLPFLISHGRLASLVLGDENLQAVAEHHRGLVRGVPGRGQQEGEEVLVGVPGLQPQS